MEKAIKIKPEKYYIIYLPLEIGFDDTIEICTRTFNNDHIHFLIGNEDYIEFDDKESWELYYQLNK